MKSRNHIDQDLSKSQKRIVTYYTGKPKEEIYHCNGKIHREDGPAVTWYFRSGKVEAEFWYLNNERLSKTEFEQSMIAKKLSLI